MESDAVSNARTERVSLNALKFQRDDALRTVANLAEEHDVRVDSINERRRGASVDINVTVTGGRDQIVSFCRAAGGIPAHESPSARLRRRVRTVVNAVLDSVP
jgi:hypothetical protein